MRTVFKPILFVSLFVISPAECLYGEVDEPNMDDPILSIVDAVLREHVDPPTRQQMLLEGAKAVYTLTGESFSSSKLSEQVSSLASRTQYVDFVSRLRTELRGKAPNFDDRFIAGMLRSLPGGGMLLPAEEVRVQGQVAANRYVGIGIALTMVEDQPVIGKVFYRGPGRESGVKSGDLILEIDGESTAGKSLQQVVKELRGEEGSVVTLLLQQREEAPRELPITRSVTFIPTLEGSEPISEGKWNFTVPSHPHLAYVKVKQIGPSTVHELKQVEATLRDKDITGLVLDLREGGGILHDVVLLADQLLDRGIIGHVVGAESVKHEARPGCLFKDVPISVLVAGFSNADRVYLAAALQDNGRAIIVGEPNRDAVFVRQHVDLPTGEKLLLATGRLQRGDGTMLAAVQRPWRTLSTRVRGNTRPKATPNFIVPDYHVRYPLRKEGISHEEDPFLAKAIEVLTKKSKSGPST